MPIGRKPTVFVSSTCYDLKQIRADIKEFFEEQLEFDILLSEYSTFPLDPNVGTLNNCLRAVDERADIFVLVVGCRYGSITKTGHSVTNMEYLRAKAKGIPIYAFVDKKILSALPLWEDNPNLNFQSTVDTPKLFEFVDSFRNNDEFGHSDLKQHRILSVHYEPSLAICFMIVWNLDKGLFQKVSAEKFLTWKELAFKQFCYVPQNGSISCLLKYLLLDWLTCQTKGEILIMDLHWPPQNHCKHLVSYPTTSL